MSVADSYFNRSRIVPTILSLWIASAPLSLLAGEPIAHISDYSNAQLAAPNSTSQRTASSNRQPDLWISDRPSIIRSSNQADLPTPTENLSTPKQLEIQKSPQAYASDREEPAQCFVAAPMNTLTVNITTPAGLLPQDVASECTAKTVPVGDARLQGDWALTCHHRAPTCQTHQPLYFEEIGAERYGHTSADCLQPLISAGRFFLTIPILPYKMAVDCPADCKYTLGHYRPGSCAPWRLHHNECSGKAALVQTGFIVGLIFLIP